MRFLPISRTNLWNVLFSDFEPFFFALVCSLLVKFSVHRALVVLKAIVLSISEASAISRTVAFEGLKSLLPLVQEYFEVYKDDHGKDVVPHLNSNWH